MKNIVTGNEGFLDGLLEVLGAIGDAMTGKDKIREFHIAMKNLEKCPAGKKFIEEYELSLLIMLWLELPVKAKIVYDKKSKKYLLAVNRELHSITQFEAYEYNYKNNFYLEEVNIVELIEKSLKNKK